MRYLVMAAALAAATGASAQEGERTPVAAQAADGRPPQRIRSVTLTPGQKCPPAASADEVVVCYSGGNPYRIPPTLRESAPSATNQSWVNRAATVDQVSRVNGGLPNTCSPVGTGGQSGCALLRNQEYGQDRRERARDEESVPGGEE